MRSSVRLGSQRGDLARQLVQPVAVEHLDLSGVAGGGWTVDPLFAAVGCRYLTCGAGSVILMWTLGDLPLNREELVSRLYGMMTGGLNRPCPMSGLSARKAVCCEKFT